jgi:hypothetical protein
MLSHPSGELPSPPSLDTLLRRGLGRAVLRVRADYEPDRDRAVILRHATNREVFDRQLEGTRGLLLADVIRATGDETWYARELADALRAPGDRHVGAMLDTAWRLAKAGAAELRPPIYETLARCVADGDTTGVEAVVQLDGEAGVRSAARLLAGRFGATPPAEDRYPELCLLYAVEDVFGDEAARLMDRLTAARGPVSRYLRDLRTELSAVRTSPRRRAPLLSTYEAIRAELDARAAAGARFVPAKAWARGMDGPTAFRLADDLRAETNDNRLPLLLRVFGELPLPGDFSRLEELTRRPDKRIAWPAVLALGQIRHGRVRRRGLEMFNDGDFREAVELFVKNPGQGDADRINSLMARELDEGDYHLIGLGVLDYVEANPEAPLGPALCSMYECGPCSMCRDRVVEGLLARGLLTDDLRAECAYDASDGIRELVAENAG